MLPHGRAAIRTFRVIPALPPSLRPLLDIAHNMWWSWTPSAADLFQRLDRDLWDETRRNPVMFLGRVPQETLDRAAKDSAFIHAVSLVHATLQGHLASTSWFERAHPDLVRDPQRPFSVAYFSAEFGLAECFQIYSGGLGVLSGDHLKSSSELGVPLTAVGLLYRCGYFHQYLSSDGWQQETYPEIDFSNQPVRRVLDEHQQQVRVRVYLPGRDVHIGVWRCDVGRVPLYLLDTNLPENSPDDRDITRNLYGGDIETRIKQEIVLGIGGVRALEAVGVRPTVFHLNEGHSAFLALERIRAIREKHQCAFDEALEAAAASNVFTTHTPVPAGIDRFAPDLIERYLKHMTDGLGLDLEGLLALGRENVFDRDEFFSMAVLALRTSRRCNAVSRLHGQVSRRMWSAIWPGTPTHEIPIGHVTNGVHARTWIKPALIEIYDRYLDPAWRDDPSDHTVWAGVRNIPDEEIWHARERAREQLVVWCRRRIREQHLKRGAAPDSIDEAAAALDPRILTIGFARRFATYKRGALLLRDLKRLNALLSNEDTPIQILIAGKSHPADGPGKELIRELVQFAKSDSRANRVVFLEDYDMEIGRRLVQGCDVWLNTPRRGMEASGTSGMKAAMNGVVHISVLDGWWDEAYDYRVGFAIGRGEVYTDTEQQDDVESRALYDILERQVLPEFYDRDQSGLPRRWIRRVKRCIASLAPAYNTNRMVQDYADRLYVDAHRQGGMLVSDNLAEARGLAESMRRARRHWSSVRIADVRADVGPAAPIHSTISIEAIVEFDGLMPEELRVQAFHGTLTGLGDIADGRPADLRYDGPVSADNPRAHRFTGQIRLDRSGQCGVAVRVLPSDKRLASPFVPGLITWESPDDGAPARRPLQPAPARA